MKKRLLSFALAMLMIALAVPTVVFPVFATEEATATVSKWEPGNAVEAPNLLPRDSDLIRFFRWYKSDDLNTPLAAGTTLDASCVAVINPDLITAGVFTADDTLDSAYAKFCAYMKQQNLVTPVNSDWCYGNVKAAGTFTQAKYYAHYHNLTLFTVRGGKIEIGDMNEYIAPEADFDRMTKYLMSDALSKNVMMDVSSGEGVAITAESAKTVKVKDISVTWSNDVASIPTYTYLTNGSTALGFLSGQMYVGWGSNDQAGFRWTAPKDGEVTMTLDAVSSDKPDGYKWKIMLNDEFVQEDWQTAAQNSVAEVNAAFSELGTMTVKKGDTITLVIEKPVTYFTPTISANFICDKDVSFLDKDGEVLFSTSVKAGSAMPKAPYAAAAEGWIINGEAATELPETVTEDMEIKYAGDFTIADVAVEAASISVSSNFAINLFLRADAYAVSAGAADDFGEQYVGMLQQDGTYKITIPGVNAKDMAKPFTLCLFQEFADGKSYDNEDLYTVVPADILATYADSDATDAEKAIAAAALDYTKAESAYFAGEALDAEVAARLAQQDAAIAALASDVQQANDGDYMIDGITLILRDQVGFKIRVVSSMYTELEDSILGYSVTVEGNGTETPFTGFAFTEGDEGLSVVMSLGGVAVADFDVTYKITVRDAGGFAVSEAFEYSVNDYIARMFDADAKDANVIRAIYALGVAANA